MQLSNNRLRFYNQEELLNIAQEDKRILKEAERAYIEGIPIESITEEITTE